MWGLSRYVQCGGGVTQHGGGVYCAIARAGVQSVLDSAVREYKQVAQKDCKLTVSSEQYLSPDWCVGGGQSSPPQVVVPPPYSLPILPVLEVLSFRSPGAPSESPTPLRADCS